MDLSEIFADVDPIAQDDAPHAVCCIDYPSEFEEAHGYLRAMLRKNERSERSLELTSICLKFNPANYTTWWFRRQILSTLSMPPEGMNENTTFFKKDFITKDLKLTTKLGGSNPKNYQVWYHRRSLLEHSFSAIAEGLKDEESLRLVNDELKYISSVFLEDAKNYHAWTHRQWILKTINMEEKWTEELDVIHELLIDDVRNNSAWNHRWFVTHRGSKCVPFPLEEARQEVKFVIAKARLDPFNECPWRYFIALIKEQRKIIGNVSEFVEFLSSCEDALNETIKAFQEQSNDGMECVHMIAAYIDILEMKGGNVSLSLGKDLAEKMGSRYDPVRRNYWVLKAKQIEKYLKGDDVV